MTCPAAVHDTLDAYKNRRCRCPAARRENTRSMIRYRLRLAAGSTSTTIDATGTRRRIQALVATGWTMGHLGRQLGITTSAVSQIATKSQRVYPRTAAAVAAVYDELADLTGPATTGAVRARNRGWLPPLWWDDDTIDDPTWTPPLTDHPRSRDDVDPVIVDRLVNGAYTGRPTPAERFHAFVRLTRQGVSSTEIERLLHLSWQRIAELRALADTVSIGRAA